VEEEVSLDIETTHLAETIGDLALNQIEEMKLASFSWDSDKSKEGSITGFQVLENGEAICTSTTVTARQLSCEISTPTYPTTFTIQALLKNGGISAPSNSTIYTPWLPTVGNSLFRLP